MLIKAVPMLSAILNDLATAGLAALVLWLVADTIRDARRNRKSKLIFRRVMEWDAEGRNKALR